MLVPATVALSTSPSPAKVPPTIFTVALASVRAVDVGDRDGRRQRGGVALGEGDRRRHVARASAGCRAMSTVVVTGALRLNEPEPSLSTQVMVRVVLEPKLFGLAPDAKVTSSSTGLVVRRAWPSRSATSVSVAAVVARRDGVVPAPEAAGDAAAASTSPSPANVPPVTATVAPVSVRLSGSATVSDGDSVTVLLSVNATWAAWPVSVGASLTAVTLMVVVCAALRLNEPLPSLTTQVTVRVGSEPKLVGLSPVDAKRHRVEHLLVVRQRVGARQRQRLGGRVVARRDAWCRPWWRPARRRRPRRCRR